MIRNEDCPQSKDIPTMGAAYTSRTVRQYIHQQAYLWRAMYVSEGAKTNDGETPPLLPAPPPSKIKPSVQHNSKSSDGHLVQQ